MMRWFSALDRKSDKEGFIVVYPDGTGAGSLLTWNAGAMFRLGGNRADDVAFMRELLDDMGKAANVDAKRVMQAYLRGTCIVSFLELVSSLVSLPLYSSATMPPTTRARAARPRTRLRNMV
jgi:hypothetical protein